MNVQYVVKSSLDILLNVSFVFHRREKLRRVYNEMNYAFI